MKQEQTVVSSAHLQSSVRSVEMLFAEKVTFIVLDLTYVTLSTAQSGRTWKIKREALHDSVRRTLNLSEQPRQDNRKWMEIRRRYELQEGRSALRWTSKIFPVVKNGWWLLAQRYLMFSFKLMSTWCYAIIPPLLQSFSKREKES